MLIKPAANPSAKKQPERRKFIERRRDHVTRAMVNSKLLAEHAEKLPEGRERHAAIAAVMRLANEVSTALDRRNAMESMGMKREIESLALLVAESPLERRRRHADEQVQGPRGEDILYTVLWVVIGAATLMLFFG
ncbi:MAG: hypothetical protein NT173_10775 [Opitutales bacterium]|nr:hypothetical protein [Opitutales bacterium]